MERLLHGDEKQIDKYEQNYASLQKFFERVVKMSFPFPYN